MLTLGTQSPEFSLPDKDDNLIRLSDFQGKWVVLYFYPKDNTSGCTTEAIQFSKELDSFAQLNAVVIGISPDSCASHKKFADKQNLTVMLLSDTEKKVLEQYGVWQLKKMYGREYYGVVRTTYLINPEGKIVNIWEKVKVAGHVETVLAKIRELS